MTMHTTSSLPIQLATPGPQSPSPRNNISMPNDGVNFGATLTRQIEQRQLDQRQQEQRQSPVQPQQQSAMPAPTPAAAPKPQAAPKPATNEAKPAPREASKQPVKESAPGESAGKTEAAPAAGAQGKTAAAEGEAGEDPGAAGAKAAGSVVDMLALMASLHQVQLAPATVVPTAADAGAAAGTLLSNLKDQLGETGTPVVKLDADAALTAGAGQPQQKAEPGIDLRALDLGKAADSARLPLDGADFAAHLKDSAAQAAVKDAAPGFETLTSLTTQATALQTAQAAGSVAPDRLSARVGTPAWDNQVGQKVIWMVGGEEQSATLELNPPDLGPVQVVLNVSNDMASVTFSAQQMEVRQALENSLPRLREMMSESGIALGNASVNAGSEGRQDQEGQGSNRQGGGSGNGGGDSAVAEAAPRPRTRILGGAGAVDTFA